MQSLVSFTMHKYVRSLGGITETDMNHWRKLLRSCSPCNIQWIDFETVRDSANRMARCTINFDGDVDISTVQRMARKTGLMYVEFSDFSREVPLAIAAI